MKKLIIGIIAVFCVEVAFITYTGIDRQFGTMVAVNEIAEQSTPVADLPDVSTVYKILNADFEGEDIIISTLDRRRAARSSPAARVFSFRKTTIEIPKARTEHKTSQLTAFLPKPSTTKIRNENPAEFAAESEIDEMSGQSSAQTAEQSEKKSFLSKSVSVIKKPYSWLKALGSKLK